MYKTIYIIISDFIQSVEADTKLCSLCKDWNGRRGPKRRLSITQVIALNIMRFLLHIKDLKAFHKTVKMLDLIPALPNYENFLKASNKALPVMTLFLQVLLAQNRELNKSDIHFMDSTPISTCLNRRIFSHKVTKGFASRGKSTKGWFHGFKLHGVCNQEGILESVYFTSGNANDSKLVEKITERMKGKFFADAGYLKKASELKNLAESGRFIYSATRKNMNRLMSFDEWNTLRKRNIIESDWGTLKQNFFLEYHQARDMNGLFRHYVTAISAYILQCRLNSVPKLKTRI